VEQKGEENEIPQTEIEHCNLPIRRDGANCRL
jgi:hypothetical protein